MFAKNLPETHRLDCASAYALVHLTPNDEGFSLWHSMRLFSYANLTTMLNMLLSFDLDNFHNRHFVNLNLSYRPKDRYSFEEFAIDTEAMELMMTSVWDENGIENILKACNNFKSQLYANYHWARWIYGCGKRSLWKMRKFFFFLTCWFSSYRSMRGKFFNIFLKIWTNQKFSFNLNSNKSRINAFRDFSHEKLVQKNFLFFTHLLLHFSRSQSYIRRNVLRCCATFIRCFII